MCNDKGRYENQLVRYTFSKIRATLSFYVVVLQDFFAEDGKEVYKDS